MPSVTTTRGYDVAPSGGAPGGRTPRNIFGSTDPPLAGSIRRGHDHGRLTRAVEALDESPVPREAVSGCRVPAARARFTNPPPAVQRPVGTRRRGTGYSLPRSTARPRATHRGVRLPASR